MRRFGGLKKLAMLGILAGIAGALYAGGAFERLGELDGLRTMIAGAGAYGAAAYVAAFALVQPLGAPGVLFVVAAALVWPFCLAFGLAWLGSILAGTVGFCFARGIGRDWIADRLPKRLRAYDDRLAERGWRTVLIVRVLFFLSAPAHWALGLSKVRTRAFVLGSALGFLPGVLLLTAFGKKAAVCLGL